jgi:esterase/lipase superfamily enzyme
MVAVAFTALALCLAGCQPMAYLMSPPLQILRAEASALKDYGSDDQMTLLYATTRQPLGIASARSYGEDFSAELRLGVATLSVEPEGPGARDVRALPSLSNVRDHPTLRLEKLEERAVFGPSEGLDALNGKTAKFFSDIDQVLSASADKDVFVYVHGANNSVYRTAAQAAQYRPSTDRGSVVVAFAWPTVDNYLDYASDVRNAQRSVPVFARFIELLARHTRAEHINIMAHSAGARIVSGALASLGADAQPDRFTLLQRLRLGEVYYAAADIEIKTFVSELKSYSDLPMRVTLQVNSGDYVLAFLGMSSGNSRAGRPNFDELSEAERASLRDWAAASRLDIVDVSSERAGDLPGGAHAFWYERQWVSSDVILEFIYHASPAQRGLTATDKEGLRRWIFPSDYEQRAAAATGRLHGP